MPGHGMGDEWGPSISLAKLPQDLVLQPLPLTLDILPSTDGSRGQQHPGAPAFQ